MNKVKNLRRIVVNSKWHFSARKFDHFLLVQLLICQYLMVPVVTHAQSPFISEQNIIKQEFSQTYKNGFASVSYSKDGKYIVTAGKDTTVRIWNAELGTFIKAFPKNHREPITEAIFSPDSKTILSCSEESIRLWDVDSGTELRKFSTKWDGYNLKGKPWGLDNGAEILKFNGDGNYFLSTGGREVGIRLWDISKDLPVKEFKRDNIDDNWLTDFAFNKNENQILTGDKSGNIIIWDRATGEIIRNKKFPNHNGSTSKIKFSDSGRLALVFQGEAMTPDFKLRGKFSLVDIVEGFLKVSEFDIGDERVSDFNVSEDEKIIYALIGVSSLRIWDLNSNDKKANRIIYWPYVLTENFSISSDQRNIMIADGSKLIQWEASSRSGIEFTRARFTTDGDYLVTSCSDHSIKLWEASSGELIQIYKSSGKEIGDFKVSPDGKWMVAYDKYDYKTSDLQYAITFWKLENKEPSKVIYRKSAPRNISFNASSTKVILEEYGKIEVINLNNSAIEQVICGQFSKAFFNLDGQIVTYGFKTDGQVILQVWDKNSNSERTVALDSILQISLSSLSTNSSIADHDFHYAKINDDKLSLTEYPDHFQFNNNTFLTALTGDGVSNSKLIVWERATGKIVKSQPLPSACHDNFALFNDSLFLQVDSIPHAILSYKIPSLTSTSKTLSGLWSGLSALNVEARLIFMTAHSETYSGQIRSFENGNVAVLDAGNSAINEIKWKQFSKKYEVKPIVDLAKETGGRLKLIDPTPHAGYINQIKYTSNGKYLLSAGVDGYVKLYEARSLKMLRTLEHGEPIIGIDISDNDSLVMAFSKNKISQWDLLTGILGGNFSTKCEILPIRGAFFIPGSNNIWTLYGSTISIISSNPNGFSEVYNQVFDHFGDWTTSFNTPNKEYALFKLPHYSNQVGDTLALFETKTRKIIKIPMPSGFFVNVINDSTILWRDIADQKRFTVFNFKNRRVVYRAQTKVYESISYLTNKGYLVSRDKQNGIFKLQTSASDSTIRSLPFLDYIFPHNFIINSSGKIALLSYENSIAIYDFEKDTARALITPSWASCLELNPDQTKIAVGRYDGRVSIHSLYSSELIESADLRFYSWSYPSITNDTLYSILYDRFAYQSYSSLSIGSDRESSQTLSRGSFHMRNFRNGQLLSSFGNHDFIDKSVSGKYLILGDTLSKDKFQLEIVSLNNMQTKTLYLDQPGISQNGQYFIRALISNDEKTLLTETSTKIDFWDLSRMKNKYTLTKDPLVQYVVDNSFSNLFTKQMDKKGKMIIKISSVNQDFKAELKYEYLYNITAGNSKAVFNHGNHLTVFSFRDKSSRNIPIGTALISNFSPDEKYLLIPIDKYSYYEIKVWDIEKNRELKSINVSGVLNNAFISADQKIMVVVLKNEILRYSFPSLEPLQKIVNVNTEFPWMIDFKKNLLIQKPDLFTVSFSDASGQKPVMTISEIDSTNYCVRHPTGLFDATSESMKRLYYVKDGSTIELDQLKTKYYEPFLWEQIMTGGELRKVPPLVLQIPPGVNIVNNDDKSLSVTLTDRGGGTGKARLKVNGKSVKEFNIDSEKDTTLTIPISSYLEFLKNGSNVIEVEAMNSGNNVMTPRGPKGDGLPPLDLSQKTNPNIYIITIGISKYGGSVPQLGFADKDALDIASALTIGAKNTFGVEKCFTSTLISSDSKNIPTKQNIMALFRGVSKKLTPDDILIVYLAGHGVNWKNNEFYYLTQEATSFDLSDSLKREESTISGEELMRFFVEIKTSNQILILDACNSGQIANNLLESKWAPIIRKLSVDGSDKHNLYVIAGCPADRSSYENPHLKQGLLTYGLLMGLKGMGLQEDKYAEVDNLSDRVKKIVEKISGRMQNPVVLPPPLKDDLIIGEYNEKDKRNIALIEDKPVFIPSWIRLVDNPRKDPLGLSIALNEKLKSSNNIFYNENIVDYPDACQLNGTYSVQGGRISITLFCDCLAPKKIEIPNITREALLQKIQNMIHK